MLQFRTAQKSEITHLVQFQIAMAWETETLKLDEPTVTQGVTAVFDNANRGQYHVCLVDKQIVGMLLLTTEWSDWRNGTVWWIHSVYFEPSHRGQGLFSKMYRYVQELAKADPQIRGLRLYVDHSNQNAQKVYEQLGMNGDHYKLYEWMKS